MQAQAQQAVQAEVEKAVAVQAVQAEKDAAVAQAKVENDAAVAAAQAQAAQAQARATETMLRHQEVDLAEVTVLDEVLGTGAFGRVSLAECHGQRMAYKRFTGGSAKQSAEIAAMLKREQRVLFVVRHPNVIALFHVCTVPGHMGLLMEYAARGSLRDVLDQEDLPPWRRFAVAAGAVAGLHALHSHRNPRAPAVHASGIMHGDIKSANLVLDQELVPKWVDFGESFNTGLSSVLPQARRCGGTQAYRAPELLRDQVDTSTGHQLAAGPTGTPYSPGCDVFSLGVLLWELATGGQPWAQYYASGNKAADALVAQAVYTRGERPPLLPGRPSPESTPFFHSQIAQCWAQQPADRPSAAALHAAFVAERGLRKPHFEPPEAGNTPPEWETDPATAGLVNMELKVVAEGSPEWDHVLARFSTAVDHPHSKRLVKVLRVQNRYLWDCYCDQRRRLRQLRGVADVREEWLWHGTSALNPKLVFNGEEGFDHRFSREGLWGKGAYFAEDARYSANCSHRRYSYPVSPAGNHQLLLAQVLVGEPYEMRPWRELRGVPVMPPVLPFAGEPRQQDYNATTGAGARAGAGAGAGGRSGGGGGAGAGDGAGTGTGGGAPAPAAGARAAGAPAVRAETTRFDSITGVTDRCRVFIVHGNGRAYPHYLVEFADSA